MHPVVPTTPTQYAFAIGILLVTPILAVFAASVQRARGEDVLSGACLVGFASGVGWLGAGVALKSLFPEYPQDGVLPEPMAMLFVLPGIISGGLTLHWFVRRRPVVQEHTRASRFVLGATVAVAALLATWGVVADVDRQIWPAKRLLPDDALIIEEHIEEDGFLPDFSYSLRARMSESSFHEWMRRLEVEPTDDPMHYGDVGPRQVDAQYREHGHYENGVGSFDSRCW